MPLILVVDDDEDLRDGMCEALRTEGYTVNSAANGEVALSRLGEGRVDLILLDLMMPVMGGLEFLQHRRADPALASIPVVVVSGSAGPYVDGACAVLRKPFEMGELLAAATRAAPRAAPRAACR